MQINKTTRRQLNKAYNKANKDGAESFIFEEREILTRYAKYLLEYFDMQLNKSGADRAAL